jgi:hypothetical protein
VREFLGVIVVRVAEHEAIAVGEGRVFRAAHHGGKEGVGHIRNDHADHVGAVAAQTTRQCAGLVSERLHGFFDAPAQKLRTWADPFST